MNRMTTGNFSGIFLDGRVYNVATVYKSIQRTFTIEEGNNSGTAISGKKIRDIIGTSFSYTIELMPFEGYMSHYYALYEELTQIKDYHMIRLPYGDTFMEFASIITIDSDTFKGNINNINEWSNLKLTVEAYEYQKIAND